MSVRDRLARLLYIVPFVEHRDGVTVQELADKLGVPPKQIEKDVELLSMVGQPPLTPDHLIDLYIEDDVVYVELDQSFKRPLRLTHDEARALVLGVKMMGRLSGYGELLDEVITKIREHLNPVDAEMIDTLASSIVMSEDGPEDLAPRFRDAVENRRRVRMTYYSVTSDAQKTYALEPLAVIQHTGYEYLLARDVGAEGLEKLFRLDRMSEVQILEERFELEETPDLSRFQEDALVPGGMQMPTEVYFASAVAGRIRERFAPEQTEVLDDGGVLVRMEGASLGWLARWVLPFGVDAEVMGPPDIRQAVGERCERALARYS